MPREIEAVFFYDGLQPRGLAYEFMTEFANMLNAGKSINARIYALFLPSSRDRFIPDIVNGSDAKFDEPNRHVFAFAACNAGPARIREFRATAAKEGLDPNEGVQPTAAPDKQT